MKRSIWVALGCALSAVASSSPGDSKEGYGHFYWAARWPVESNCKVEELRALNTGNTSPAQQHPSAYVRCGVSPQKVQVHALVANATTLGASSPPSVPYAKVSVCSVRREHMKTERKLAPEVWCNETPGDKSRSSPNQAKHFYTSTSQSVFVPWFKIQSAQELAIFTAARAAGATLKIVWNLAPSTSSEVRAWKVDKEKKPFLGILHDVSW